MPDPHTDPLWVLRDPGPSVIDRRPEVEAAADEILAAPYQFDGPIEPSP